MVDFFKYGYECISEEESLYGGLVGYMIIRRNIFLVKIDEVILLGVVVMINCVMFIVVGILCLVGKFKVKIVLIFGVGMLGVVVCVMCKVGGVDRVVVLDLNEKRL